MVEEEVSFKLRKFEMSSMQDDKTVLLLGKRNTGKSTLLEDILYHLSNSFDIGFGMTLTQDTARSFAKFMPESFIHNKGVKTETLEGIIDMLRKVTEADNTGTDKVKVYGVLDDVASQKGIFNSETMRDIFMNGRHYHVFFVILLQYVMDIGPSIRSQIDYVFILRCTGVDDRKKIYKNFFGIFPDFETFEKVFDQCTEGFDCIVLDNTVRSNKIEDCVFWYRAQPRPPNFRLCNREAWKLHYMFYEPQPVDFDDDGCPIPALVAAKKKKELKEQQQQQQDSDDATEDGAPKPKLPTTTIIPSTKSSTGKGSSSAAAASAAAKGRTGARGRKGAAAFTITVEKRDEQGNMIVTLPQTPAMVAAKTNAAAAGAAKKSAPMVVSAAPTTSTSSVASNKPPLPTPARPLQKQDH